MIAATATMEFVSTKTETEALLLEANLIKRLRPRFNVLLRDDKSFPYILITVDHWAPQILKHRGARTRQGQLFRAVRLGRRGQPHHQRAAARVPAALLLGCVLREPHAAVPAHQIKRCSAPCTGEIDFAGYAELVREANDFLSGRSQAVQKELAAEMDKASARARFRARRDLSRPAGGAVGDPVASGHQSAQRRGGRRVRRASGRRLHLRRGVLLPHRAELGQPRLFPQGRPRARRRPRCSARSSRSSTTTSRRRGCILVSHEFEERELLAEALTAKSGRKVEVARAAARREARNWSTHALANAREALARKLADTSSQQKLLDGAGRDVRAAARAAPHRGLRQQPHQGTQRGRRHDRRRAGRLPQEPVPQVQHPLGRPHARRRLRHDARGAAAPLQAADRRRAPRADGRRGAAGRADAARPTTRTTSSPGPIWC